MTTLRPDYIRQQIANLLLAYPELAGDDEETRALAIDTETDATTYLSMLVRELGDNDAMCVGIDKYIAALVERRSRFNKKDKALRTLIMKVMEAADIRKMPLPEATISLSNGRPKLVGERDPRELPPRFVRVTTEANKTAIKDAIEAGETVEGYQLSNGAPSLTVRMK